MKKSLLYVLIALMLVIGAAAVACGGGGDNGDKDSKEPTVAEEQDGTPEAEATEEEATPESSGDGASSGSFADVPVYPGATEITSGEWSGSEGMIPGLGSELDTEDFQKIEFAMYETDDSLDDVFDWYKDKMGDWNEEGSASGGSGGEAGAYGLWTKDDGKVAAWITVGEVGGTTSLGVWVATQ